MTIPFENFVVCPHCEEDIEATQIFEQDGDTIIAINTGICRQCGIKIIEKTWFQQSGFEVKYKPIPRKKRR